MSNDHVGQLQRETYSREVALSDAGVTDPVDSTASWLPWAFSARRASPVMLVKVRRTTGVLDWVPHESWEAHLPLERHSAIFILARGFSLRDVVMGGSDIVAAARGELSPRHSA